MKTNLNYLFIDQIINFSHLVTSDQQTKAQFLETIKRNYCLSNAKTKLFYIACEKSIFETIKLSDNKESILFNS